MAGIKQQVIQMIQSLPDNVTIDNIWQNYISSYRLMLD